MNKDFNKIKKNHDCYRHKKHPFRFIDTQDTCQDNKGVGRDTGFYNDAKNLLPVENICDNVFRIT